MGNFSIYLPEEHKQKLIRITQRCNVRQTTVLRVIMKQMPEDYLCDLVNNYKEQELASKKE